MTALSIPRAGFKLTGAVIAACCGVMSLTGAASGQVSYELVHAFTRGPQSVSDRLLQASDGTIYGTASDGGVFGSGAVFKVEPAGAVTVLHAFGAPGDGASPVAGLIQGADGNFYGTTTSGGLFGSGTVFTMDAAGNVTTLHSFNLSSDGGQPVARLLQASDGALYGTTQFGGLFGFGTAFKVDGTGTFTTLHAFAKATDGSRPAAPLIQAADGGFYGTTQQGGAFGRGTLFKIDAAGTVTALHSFVFVTDGANPVGGLLQAPDGALYGTTMSGGPLGSGTVFKMDAGGALLTVVHAFGGAGDGASPRSALIRIGDGSLYGTTAFGGASGNGTVFKIDGAGALAILHSFGSSSDGAVPIAGLLQTSDGSFYGTTRGGGAAGAGTIFKMDGAGAVTTVHAFGTDAAAPYGGVIQGRDGSFYGMTESGGAFGFGSVFKMDAAGTVTPLASFDSSTGAFPSAELLQAADGAFYGTTPHGGASGYGTVFRMDTAGTVTLLHAFDYATDGAMPAAGLIQASDGSFYGTTQSGGAGGNGTVFKMDAAGTLTTLHAFDSSGGASPFGRLLQGSDGSFYGTTRQGGSFGAGTVFKMDGAGTVVTLHSFDYASEGGSPLAGLIQASDGSFYGTAQLGGAFGSGTAFRMDPAGAVSVLHAFNSATDGAYPSAALLQASDGSFYGTTQQGGGLNAGTVFKMNAGGALTTLRELTSATDGAHPFARLVLASDGNFYGTTPSGGPQGGGVVFRLATASASTTALSMVAAAGVYGGDATLSARLTVSGSPLAAQSIAFSLSGTLVGSAVTDGSGTAAQGGVGLAGLGAGTYAGAVQASFGGAAGYAPSSGVGDLVVARASQTITFAALPDRVLGDPPFAVVASASSGLMVIWSASGACSASGNTVTLTDVGSCTVMAAQPGDANYLAAPDVSRKFNITYHFAGFFGPVDNLPAVNSAKAGSAVAVKWSLGGDQGLGVLAPGYPASGTMPCGSAGAVAPTDPTAGAGGSGLSFDGEQYEYVYVWKTDKTWAGSCRQLVIKLRDGTEHRANFRFK